MKTVCSQIVCIFRLISLLCFLSFAADRANASQLLDLKSGEGSAFKSSAQASEQKSAYTFKYHKGARAFVSGVELNSPSNIAKMYAFDFDDMLVKTGSKKECVLINEATQEYEVRERPTFEDRNDLKTLFSDILKNGNNRIVIITANLGLLTHPRHWRMLIDLIGEENYIEACKRLGYKQFVDGIDVKTNMLYSMHPAPIAESVKAQLSFLPLDMQSDLYRYGQRGCVFFSRIPKEQAKDITDVEETPKGVVLNDLAMANREVIEFYFLDDQKYNIFHTLEFWQLLPSHRRNYQRLVAAHMIPWPFLYASESEKYVKEEDEEEIDFAQEIQETNPELIELVEEEKEEEEEDLNQPTNFFDKSGPELRKRIYGDALGLGDQIKHVHAGQAKRRKIADLSQPPELVRQCSSKRPASSNDEDEDGDSD